MYFTRNRIIYTIDNTIKTLYDSGMSQEKKERNEQIYKLWKDKYGTISDIARKFDLEPEVAWRIIKRYANMEANNAT